MFEIAKLWIADNPTSSLFLLSLMAINPIEKLILPSLSAEILKNLHNSTLLKSILNWFVVFVIVSYLNYVYDQKKHSIVRELNDRSVKTIFEKIVDSEWSVVNNDVFELLTIIQASNSYSWKVMQIASSLLGGQIFTILGTLYIFSQNATWYVTSLLIVLILLGFCFVASSVQGCRGDIHLYNKFRSETLSNIADIISSRSILDEARNKHTFIDPALNNLRNQNEKEYYCRANVSHSIRLVSGLSTALIYLLLFYDVLHQNMSTQNFTTLFLVAMQVFDLPLALEGCLYENMHVEVFEKDLYEKLKPRKQHKIQENDNITLKNVKIRHLPVDQPYIDLTVRIGTITSLKGSNGCGKSSLLRIIAGLEAPLNEDAEIEAPKRLMYVPQNANLVNRSIIENVGLGLRKNPSEKQITDMLTKNNLQSYIPVLQKYMYVPVGELGKKLSGGQRQIVWMLRLLYSKQKFALLDEPTSWMEANVTKSYLNCLRKNSITALIVTHDQNVQSFADVELEWNDLIA